MDAWVEGRELLQGLRGQVLRVPIRGTVSRPELDLSAIGQLSRQLAVKAGEGLLRRELQGQLQKLFGN